MQRGLKVRGVLAGLICVSVFGGCRTDERDVHRWARTQHGPEKLAAVVEHSKYPRELRVLAAINLITMPPRGGQRVGIDSLADVLVELPPEQQQQLVGPLVDILIAKLAKPAPVSEEGVAMEDPTLPVKDAAYTLLTHTPEALITQEQHKERLRTALSAWAAQDFASRMDAPGQKVSMVQMLRTLGPKSVEGLPTLLTAEGAKTGRIAQIIAEVGAEGTKVAASHRLVEIAKEVSSEAWLQKQKPLVEAANKKAELTVKGKRLEAQLVRFRQEELLRAFSALKRVGQTPAIDYLIGVAVDEHAAAKVRQGALAGLEDHIMSAGPASLERLFKMVATKDTSTELRALALRRIGELPRDVIAPKLFELFKEEDWKVRQAAAELLLLKSELQHLPEFMAELGKLKSMAVPEPLRYGRLIGELKGSGKPAPQQVSAYLTKTSKTPAHLAALGYFYAHGDLDTLKQLSFSMASLAPLPPCPEDSSDCRWVCSEKELRTISDFVKFCVVPPIEERTKSAAAAPRKNQPGSPPKPSPEAPKNK